MALTERVREFLRALLDAHRGKGYIPRLFRAAEEWDKWSNHDWRGHRFGNEPGLSSLLEQRRIVVLGEPGSGKSTLADAAVRAAMEKGWVTVVLKLREYRGDLSELIRSAVPETVLADALAHPPTALFYVLDGFDEVPSDLVSRFLDELASLEQHQPECRLLLTSRQAFFVNRRHLFRQPIPAFYLLDFNSDDIDEFIERRGGRRREFLEAAAAAQLSRELSNPFALGALLSLFEAKNALGKTRSEAVEHVITQTLTSRPTFDPKRELQALRMLALAMEIAARNELLEAEAIRVLRLAFRVGDADAKQLLDELSHSILIRTPNGYAFQMRSYGEYLAAAELAEVRERNRLLEPIFVDETRDPQDSWRNAVSYLVEMHSGARSYFTTWHPDWLVTSSPAVFEVDERTELIRSVLQRLKDRREYLTHHPLVRAADLGRFVTPDVAQDLKRALGSADDVDVANAILLLGSAGIRDASQAALELGLDPNRSLPVRHSALNALDWIGAPEMIPQLLAISDFDEPTVVSRIDTACALMDPRHTGLILEYLTKTDTTMSAAYYRFRQLEKPEEFDAVLDGLLSIPPEMLTSRLSIFLDHMWPAMVRVWQPRWAPKVTDLLLRTEEDYENDVAEKLAKALLASHDGGAAIGKLMLTELLVQGRELRGFPRTIPQLVSVADAEWLEAQPNSEELVRYLRAFGSPDVRQFLFRNVQPASADAKVAGHTDKWQRRGQAEEDRINHLLEVLHHSNDPGELLNALFRLDFVKWPDLNDLQRGGLAKAVESKLNALDLAKRIVWKTESSWTIPGALPVVLRAIDRYELRLANDRVLVPSLLAQEVEALVHYHQRVGLSRGALADVERMLNEPSLPSGALDGALDFTVKARLNTATVRAAFEAILVSGRPERTKLNATSGLGQTPEGIDVIAAHLKNFSGDLLRSAERELLTAQHLPTIRRRLAHLENDPALLAAGNVDQHFNHPLDWIGHIKHPEAWKSLKRLRRQALQNSLDHVMRIITGTMANIDKLNVAKVILEQINDAPTAWQPYQRRQAVEYERDGKIMAAQGAPFERVLERLKAFSTMNRFKLWVEGPNDRPGLQSLAGRVAGDLGDVIVQPIGGWAQILSEHWSPRGLGDGCSDFLMLLDGDRARDWSKPGNPIRREPELRDVLRKFNEFRIPYHILERYALENYFPQSAYEKVMGTAVAKHFPLDPTKGVTDQLPGYNKRMNGALADATDIADLAGTDLGSVLEQIRRRLQE